MEGEAGGRLVGMWLVRRGKLCTTERSGGGGMHGELGWEGTCWGVYCVLRVGAV